jgi:hypothetical protein
MADITVDDVIEATFEVLEERGPGYVYEKPGVNEYGEPVCKYSTDEGATGSCLFGAALIEKLKIPYSEWWDSNGGVALPVLLDRLIPDADRDNRFYALGSAQANQDMGKRYGEVRASLEDRLANTNAR